ncbi:MAG TPA: hypothetical protein VNR89_03435 [Roseomonas sp.]|nr:hypothetical protein [Roseomonas sp.]
MAPGQIQLPTRDGRPFLADGGLETALVFHEGMDLPAFAAFPLLRDGEGRQTLRRCSEPYLRLAAERGAGFVLETVTWRANVERGAKIGDDAAAAAVRFASGLRDDVAEARIPILINGVIGPRYSAVRHASG